MRRKMFLESLMFCMFFVFLSGCSPSALDVREVRGTVTYQGKPLEGASVVFSPQVADGKGRSAADVTNQDGRYVLSTPGAKRKGAMMGEYEVRVIKTTAVDKSGKKIEIKAPESGEVRGPRKAIMPRGGRPELKSLIPEKYNNPDEALLHATVKKGANTIDFELTD